MKKRAAIGEAMKVLFVTDLHGRSDNLHKAVRIAEEMADALILGGDIHPIGHTVRPSDQYRFFLSEVAEPLEGVGVRIFAIMGNVDWKVNLKRYRDMHPHPVHWLNLEDGRLGDLLIAGMSHVPVTPFSIKDWDAFDGDAPLPREATFQGLHSTPEGLEVREVGDGTPNIADVLEEIGRRMKGRRWILVSHCPPYGTSLDVASGGVHVGSRALKDFLGSPDAPILSLHGHIHESPLITGKFCERVGNTLACNPGDSRSRLRALLIEVGDRKIDYNLIEG